MQPNNNLPGSDQLPPVTGGGNDATQQPPYDPFGQPPVNNSAGPPPVPLEPFPNVPPSAPLPGQVNPAVSPIGYPQSVVGGQVAPQANTLQPKVNPNSTQNALQIAEVRDGIVIMNDGSFRSVVMVKSINFDLMSPQEREAVEFSYQGFLNSLYFPVQIFIRSEKVDLRPYIERLDKIRSEHDNMLLALLMEDYIEFVANLSSQTNIMDKRFYVTIPFFPVQDITKAITQSKNFFTGLANMFNSKQQRVVINEGDLVKAKDELRNRVQSVLSALQQCGVQGLPLDTQELIELYYDTYNPDTATRQQLKNFDDLATPVVQKGEGTAPQPNLEKELS